MSTLDLWSPQGKQVNICLDDHRWVLQQRWTGELRSTSDWAPYLQQQSGTTPTSLLEMCISACWSHALCTVALDLEVLISIQTKPVRNGGHDPVKSTNRPLTQLLLGIQGQDLSDEWSKYNYRHQIGHSSKVFCKSWNTHVLDEQTLRGIPVRIKAGPHFTDRMELEGIRHWKASYLITASVTAGVWQWVMGVRLLRFSTLKM